MFRDSYSFQIFKIYLTEYPAWFIKRHSTAIISGVVGVGLGALFL